MAKGERAKRLQKGCLINDQMYYPEVWSPTEAHGVDLLIVSLKYCALKENKYTKRKMSEVKYAYTCC